MSLYKDKRDAGSPCVIKGNAPQARLKIADYKSFLQEIEADDPHTLEGMVHLFDGGTSDGGVDAKRADENSNPSRSDVTRAYEEGFEAGKNEATKALRAEYDKRVDEVVGSFTSMVSQFSEEMENYGKDYDTAIMRLSLAIARRIVAREIDLDEGAVLSRSREAIRKIIGVERVKIHVNPVDEEYIREHRSELNNYADSVKEIVIEADNRVERGGCIIESELGNIDARISTQFELIEEAFLELAK